MKKLIILISLTFAILLFAWPCHAVTYYITQSGAGNGLTSGAPDSIADFNADILNAAQVAGDTFYIGGTITTKVVPPVAGTSGNEMVLRGDFPGNACTIEGQNGETEAVRVQVDWSSDEQANVPQG